MQYPIIDNLIYAYQRNGWTGLELLPVNIWDEEWETGTISTTTGNNSVDNTRIRAKNFIRVFPNETYFIVGGRIQVYFYDINKQYIDVQSGFTGPGVPLIIPSGCYYIRFIGTTAYGPIYENNISINYPSTYTSYISAEESENNINTFKYDISCRLKLPMIHYFPHPVIDALQRAAAGSQTADDTEILRHYLTPLGIGGI